MRVDLGRPSAWFAGRCSRAAAALAVVAVAVPMAAQQVAGTIETFAGGGGGDVAVDLAPRPQGVAVDGSGNVYIADTDNNRIRKVDSSGNVSTFAGSGGSGYGGDGGAATAARMTSPREVAVDSSGNVYIADFSNRRIRKVDSSGTITTFAGDGRWGFSGDGGSATSSMIRDAYGVAVDGSDNVYIADADNDRIRKVDASSNIISTVAGGGFGFGGDGGAATSSYMNQPRDVAADASGNIYIVDYNNNRIRKVDASSNIISTFAGSGDRGFSGDGGAATSSAMLLPQGVAVDGSGNVYIADTGNSRIRKVDSAGIISTILAAPAIYYPSSVAVDGSDNVYVAEFSRVRKMDAATNDVSTLAAAGNFGIGSDGGAATSTQLAFPSGVALDGQGNVYIADQASHRIRKVDRSGNISTFAGTGGASGFAGDGGAATSSLLNTPRAVAVDGSGNVYIADTSNNRIRKVDTSGTISTIAGIGGWGVTGDGGAATSAPLATPQGVAVDGSGNVYISDINDRIRKVDTAGIISAFAGTGIHGFGGDGVAATSTPLASPHEVAVDGSGNVYIADTDNNRIRKVNSAGIISTFAGSGLRGFSGDGRAATAARLAAPQGVAVDASGNVYIADTGNRRMRKVDSQGIITTIAGTGTSGFGGDGGAAISALLSRPEGVAVDGSGNVYVVDTNNNRIRVVAPGRYVFPDAGTPAQSEPPDDAHNSPPVVRAVLEDVTLPVGQTTRIDLGSAFDDLDGDVLVYAAVSSAQAVLRAAVNHHELVLEGVADGVATVTVFATDPHGLSVEQTLAVTVGTVLWLQGDGEALEGGTVRLSVRLSMVRDVPTAFSWKVLEDADPATANADSGEHGDASSSGSIAAGETATTIDIDIADDADVERPREWFLVELLADAKDPVALGRTRAPVAVLEGVCDRTPAVAAALVKDDGCETATDAGLAALRTLLLQNAGVAALRGKDLEGLRSLRVLGLRGNELEALPAGLLSAVPGLRYLLLGGNRLAALRGDAFAGLSDLLELDLSNNALAELPAGVLSGLSDLRYLRLDGNALEALPNGLFSGASSLRSVRLDGNPGAPFALRVELRRNDGATWAEGPATIQATLAAGAPFDVELSLAATGGGFQSVDGPVSEEVQETLAAGETMGTELVVVASDGGAVRVSLSVGPLPETACDSRPCWPGLTLQAGDPLVLFAVPPTAAAMAAKPEPLFGEDLRLPLASLVTVGDLPVAQWRATSSNPAVATASVKGDELLVATEPGVQGVTEIAVMATDALGQSVTVRFEVQVAFYWPGPRRWRLLLPIAE